MFGYDRPSHQIYRYFLKQGGWAGSIPRSWPEDFPFRKLTFTGPEKIRELARGREAWGILDAKQALEHAIEMGGWGLP